MRVNIRCVGYYPTRFLRARQTANSHWAIVEFMLDGKEYRGHEFHYTQFVGEVPKSIVQVYNAKGEPVPTPVFRYKNVLASYTHLYTIDHSPFLRPDGSKNVQCLHPIMFAGTGSDVGKSIVAAAFCRIFKQDGYQPAPFKAQNMALN